MENRTIYLIRHGRIQLEDDQRRFIGQLDLKLSGEGVKQAQYLQKVFGRAEIGGVFCSDLERSRQTAQIAVNQKNIVVVARKDLREIDMGAWEGQTFAEISRRFPNEFRERGADIGYYRVPGGESFADCAKRAVAAFHNILESTSGNVVVVGHAGVNRVLLCYVLGMPLANLFKIAQDYGCLNIIQVNNHGYQVKLLNFPAQGSNGTSNGKQIISHKDA